MRHGDGCEPSGRGSNHDGTGIDHHNNAPSTADDDHDPSAGANHHGPARSTGTVRLSPVE